MSGKYKEKTIEYVATRPKRKPEDGGKGDGKDPEQARLRSGWNPAIVREKPNANWNDVVVRTWADLEIMEGTEQALLEAVNFFTGKRMSYSAFLLYGPPGTGKSYLAKAVATSADSTLFSVSSSYLVSRWMGESEKLVSNLFEMARESARQRGEGSESEASRCLKNELLVQMHDLGHDDEKVLVLAATDTLNGLDMDIIKCFSRRIYIPLPNCDAREHMFKVHLREAPHDLNEVQFRLLGLMTEGFSGYDVSVFVKDVLFEPVRKIHGAMFFLERGGMWFPCASYEPGAVETTMHGLAAQGLSLKISPLLPITMTDFCNVLARQKPMMSKLDLAYERFT